MNKDFLRKLREEGKLELSDPIKSLKSMEMLYSMGYVFNGAEWVKSIESRTKVVYERVEETIFDLKDEYYSDGFHTKDPDGNYIEIRTTEELAKSFAYDCIYRKVEKEIDWKGELESYFDGVDYLSKNDMIKSAYNGDEAEDDEVWDAEFIGMCHLVASLTDKPE